MYPRRHLPPPPPPPVHIVHTSRSYTPYYDDFQPPSPSISGTTVCLPELTASDKADSSKAQSSHSTVELERVGRTRLSDMIRKYDERRVKDVKEDIDSLLVFAGLFSAVLTAFLLESYDTLQENPQDTATQILLQISSQLAALSSPEINNANINLTNTPSSISPFTAATSSVWVNTLWSCSLILSLITSSLGLLVKQWFHEYMDHHESQSLVYLRIRFFRNEGLMKWRVFELAAFLPLLLQVSLVLFFIGLSEFLRILNPFVGWATTTVMIIWLIVFAFTTLAPVFSQQCPYNTPLLKGLVQSVRYHLYLLPYRVLVSYIDVAHFLVGQLYNAFTDTNHALKTRLYDWQQVLGDWEPKRDDFLPGLSGEAGIRDKDISDLAILVQSDSLFLDDTSKEMIASCAEELRLDSATTALCACLVGAGQGFRPAVVGGVSAPVWIPVKGLPKSSQEPLCRIFFNVIHGEVNRLSRTDSNDPKDLLQSFVTLHRSLTILLSFQSLVQTNAFQQHFPSLLFRMIDQGEHTAVCALLALYSAGNIWLKDDHHNFGLERLVPIMQDPGSTNHRNICDSSYLDTLTKATRYILQIIHHSSTEATLPIPKEARAFILHATAADKLIHHPVVLCFIYGTLVKRAVPYIRHTQGNAISTTSLEFRRALRKQSEYSTEHVSELSSDMLLRFSQIARTAFREIQESYPGSVDVRLVSELHRRSSRWGPVFERMHEHGY